MRRRLRLSIQARQDIRDIVAYSRAAFGQRQAKAYHARIQSTLADLRRDRRPRSIRTHEDYSLGLFSCRAAGASGKHLLFFKLHGDTIDVVRVLHEAMDFARHLGSPGTE